MKMEVIDDESNIIGNTILMLAISVFILAVVLTMIIESIEWITFLSICSGFVLSFGYFFRETRKIAKIKKENLKQGKPDIEGS